MCLRADPTMDAKLWRSFLAQVRLELERGHFRKTWGRGTLARIRKSLADTRKGSPDSPMPNSFCRPVQPMAQLWKLMSCSTR